MSKKGWLTMCLSLVVATEVVLGFAIREDGGDHVLLSTVDLPRQIQTNSLPGRAVSDLVAAKLLGGTETAAPFCEEWDPEYGCEFLSGEACPDDWYHLTDQEFCLLCDFPDHKSTGKADCADVAEAGGNAEENAEAESVIWGCGSGYTTTVAPCVRAGG